MDDHQYPSPPSVGLTADEVVVRFEELQRRLVEQWKLIRTMNQLEQTMVVVPSVPVTAGATGSAVRAAEERMLFLLLLLRKPRSRIIYCTSQPILPQIIDYYVGLLPGVIPSHARSRLFIVTAHDATPQPLALKILQRPRLIERLRELITDPDTTHLVPYAPSELERDLALRLGIPMFGADPELAHLGTASIARSLIVEEGVPQPPGVAEVADAAAIRRAIGELRAETRIEQVVLRLNDSAAAPHLSTAVLSLEGLPEPGDAGEEAAIAERLDQLRLAGGGTAEEFLAALHEQGGVVEQRIIADEVRHSSVQLRITPLGQVEILSTHDWDDGETGSICRFPADPSYAAAIAGQAAILGDRLRREGVLGRCEVTFLVARSGGGEWQPFASRISLGKSGTTATFLTLEFLTNGSYDPDSGFTTPGGQPKCYVANDAVSAESYRAISPDDLFDFVIRHGLHFDHTTQTGVVLHMLSAVAERGCFGLTAVADTAADASELYNRAVATLGYESERALADPGLP